MVFFFYRWDTLSEKTGKSIKYIEAQSQQWNSYQESILRVNNWLDNFEKTIASSQHNIGISLSEIKTKILKQKVNFF